MSESLQEIYNTKNKLIYSVAKRYLRNNPEFMEDAVQDFYLYLLEHKDRLFDPIKGTFRKWFNARLTYEFWNAGKRAKYRTHKLRTHKVYVDGENEHGIHVEVDQTIDNSYELEAKEIQTLLDNMNILSEVEKNCIKWMLQNDDNYSMMAREVGVTRQAVSLNMKRAIKKLRRRIRNKDLHRE